MSSAAISFPNWTPPALSSLDFSSNCTHVRAFLRSWFDLTSYEDLDAMPGRKYNVSFWVPETVDAGATETYFRNVLPFDLRDVASYGEILEWERFLRDNYTEAVKEFLNLAAHLNQTETDSLPLDIPYYEYAIYAPSQACKEHVCNLGFDWDKLGDVNGPGVFIYYILLLAIGCIYSIIALCGAFKYRLGRTKPRSRRPPQQHLSRSLRGDLFTTVKISFSGFSDGAAVFSLAIPCAVLYNYVLGGDVRVSSRKDLILELWVLVYALCICVWFYRVGACIRRAEHAKHQAMHGYPARQSKKRALATGFVLSLSIAAFVVLSMFLFVYHLGDGLTPFKFEMFWDDLCGYGALSRWDVIIAFGSLTGYCLIRLCLPGCIVECIMRRERKHTLRNQGSHPFSNKTTQRFLGVRERYKIYSTASRCRRWMDRLGMFDVLALMAGSVVILWYYHKHRERLSNSVGVESFKDGWTLGQVLAVSSLLPVVIGFFHTFVGVRDRH